MSLKGFISDGLAIRAALIIGKLLTRKAGYRLANAAGSWIARHPKFSLVRAVKANQWVVRDEQCTSAELSIFTKQVFQSSSRCLFDYYHYIGRPEKLFKIIKISSEAQVAFDRIRAQQPTIIVVSHLSSFDLMGYALALLKLKILVLSFPNPNDAYKMQNKLREKVGIEILPMSLSAFRIARAKLAKGGCILTGLDRPLVGSQLEKYQPKFFGHEANLPVAYIRMAKEANAPIFVMGCTSQANQTYTLESSLPVWMTPMDSLDQEIVLNAECVLAEAEELIKKAPEQWAMFYPVWPDIMVETVPKTGKE
ncbi:MAG: hypothetical protein MUO40_01660 [Anaerolineaceae bacterium]|nr:hypothetical protein [Anaerolineaceae bacterium]